MAVRIASPVFNTFKVDAPIREYPLMTGVTVEPGDLLYFYEQNGTIYVTNDISIDDSFTVANAIAVKKRTSPDNAICYMMQYNATYDELKAYLYDTLESFTYNQVAKWDLSTKI